MQVNPSDSVVLSGATSLHSVLAWDSCIFREQGGEKWRANRLNTTQSFSGLSRACVPSLKTGMQGGAAMQGWGCQPAEIQGPLSLVYGCGWLRMSRLLGQAPLRPLLPAEEEENGAPQEEGRSVEVARSGGSGFQVSSCRPRRPPH